MAGLGGQANIMGILSSILGLLSVVCCSCASFGGGGAYFFTLPLSIAALALGVLHLRRIKNGRATNRNLAMFGIALGVVGLVLSVCFGSSHAGTDLHNDIR
jgi:4-hydroxybenzoate polyprenyltransferase